MFAVADVEPARLQALKNVDKVHWVLFLSLGPPPASGSGDQPLQSRGLVGPAGFEPATSSTPRKRATNLRYGPNRCPGNNHSVPKGVPPTAD